MTIDKLLEEIEFLKSQGMTGDTEVVRVDMDSDGTVFENVICVHSTIRDCESTDATVSPVFVIS